MAKHKFNKTFARLLREIVKLFKTLTGQFTRWFLRTFLVGNRRGQRQAGFVLPTTAFMLLVVALVITAVIFRTYTRSSQVIREGQAQIVNNAATPAVQRAKSKIEYLFNDPNLPSDIPNEKVVEELLLNVDARNPDPYNFADETRITDPAALGVTGLDVPGTTVWAYQTDTNGNGVQGNPVSNPTALDAKDLTTVYAIVSRAERPTISIDPAEKALYDNKNKAQDRADAFIVRNGPLISQSGTSSPNCPVAVGGNENGWFNGPSTAFVHKAFQVYAITVPNSIIKGAPSTNTALATLEYQQDRKYERLNKWGAWFRYDMEIAPGPVFNWNGALHSQGNIFLRSNDGFRSFLVSAAGSCLYTPSNSAITQRLASGSDRGGQFVGGRLRENDFEPGKVSIDISPTQTITLTKNTNSNTESADSVDNNVGKPINISTDPLALHTQGISKPRKEANTDWIKDSKWDESALGGGDQARVKQAASCSPYVDDTYRADNRYGPKPNYAKEKLQEVKDENGDLITKCVAEPEADMVYGQPIASSKTDLYRDNPLPGDLEKASVGLDGYWEKRARANGLRVIVGQRLELGNPFGWNVDLDGTSGQDRALYAPDTPNSAASLANRSNEGRQYVTLRDNLAAVQTTAVYHYAHGDVASTAESEGGFFPIAFVATTAHPGTQKTIQDSTTFRNPTIPYTANNTLFGPQFGDDDNEILSNFFLGEGTNGWEFNVVPGAAQTEAAFQTLINNATSPLRRSLQNLALFAGDPLGYFPANQAAAGGETHPYPELTMWGNFSNLRETLGLLTTGTNYQNLSIADKSNLHTAAGTLGMLAYNISYLQEFDYTDNAYQTKLGELATNLAKLEDGTTATNNGEVKSTASGAQKIIEVTLNDGTTKLPPIRLDVNKPIPPEAYIAALPAADQELAKLIHLKEQVARDRNYGFRDKTFTVGPNSYGCNPTTFTGFTSTRQQAFARGLCSTEPKFPSLYYLFPTYNHGHQGDAAAGTPPPADISDRRQPGHPSFPTPEEPYVTDDYILEDAVNGATTTIYRTLVAADPNDLTGVALKPRTITTTASQRCTANYWCLPASTTTAAATDTVNKISYQTTSPTNLSYATVPFLDKAIYDGRELMNVRVLDFDLNLLRNNKAPNNSGTELWLPNSGLVYAFREDAVREDAIARPALTSWSAYEQAWNSSTGNPAAASIMRVWQQGGAQPADPPRADSGVSPKPIDYYPDPDRRPYGFRLRNGADLRRPDTSNPRGLFLISDNPVYIQGDFNLHSQEEFTDTLDVSYGDFYSRGASSDKLNTNFARAAGDTWRPTEIIADAVNILSNNFCDGTIEGGIRGTTDGCTKPNSKSSYRNSHLNGNPSNLSTTANAVGYVCENPFDPRTATFAGTDRKGCEGPIKVFRNGEMRYNPTTGPLAVYNNYRTFGTYDGENRSPSRAIETRVNSVIISGLVPTREQQSNGGMHNFPRLNENWGKSDNNSPLWFFGSMVQLNFSNYATAPYDQDAWETSAQPQTVEQWPYYWPAPRRWGYDVGLQYAPAGPISKRMVNPSLDRNEIYREPAAEDPYICKLRQAINYPCS